MADYRIVGLEESRNIFEERGWPGEMRFLTEDLEAKQVALTYRKMPQHSGGKGGYGHRHKVQEEIIYLISGELEVKLDDKIEILKAGQAIRISPHVIRSLWNEKPDPAELLIFSTKLEYDDSEIIKDFWPA